MRVPLLCLLPILILMMSGDIRAQQTQCSCVEATLQESDVTATPCPPRADQTWTVCGTNKTTFAEGQCTRSSCVEGACLPVLRTPTITALPDGRCKWEQKGENRVHSFFCNTGCKKSSRNVFTKNCDGCSSGGGGSPPPDDDDGGAGCVGGEENFDNEGCGSPILIDVRGREGFELTNIENGVFFDLDSDGTPERMAWTASGSNDAFLVLDRNGNGTIDNGQELFGNYTPQPDSDTPNGYLALAVYDRKSAGGNDDGIISPQDRVFSRLRLWLDRNHDGISQPRELDTLSRYRITGLELDYGTSSRRDEHGNFLRYWSRVYLRDGRTRLSVDVFFLRAGP